MAVLLLSTAAQLGATGSGLATAASFVTAWGAALCCAWAARACRGSSRRGWGLLAVGLAANAVGDSIYVLIDAVSDEVPVVSVADVFYLATYPFLLAGAATLVRRGAGSRARDALIDGATVAIVFALCSWQFLVVGVGVNSTGSLLQRAVLTAYPLVDALLVAVLVAVLLIAEARSPSLVLVAAFSAQLVAADVFFSVVGLADSAHLLRFSYVLYDVAYALVATGALLASRPGQRRPGNDNGADLARLWLLGGSIAAAPIVAIVAASSGRSVSTPVYTAAALTLTALVMVRIATLVRRLHREGALLRRAEAELEHRAGHDPLTGLANRRLLLRETGLAIDAARHSEEPGAPGLLFVDLDDFKVVNDSLGHRTGDELLRRVGEIIESQATADELVARLGGDEFVVLARRTSDQASVALAERILDALGRPIHIGPGEAFVSASVGIAMAEADHEPVELLRDADIAMYEAKRTGKGRIRAFDTAMRSRAAERHAVEQGLRRALDRGDGIHLAYQARVDLVTGEAVGLEALARWSQDDGTDLAPDVFIPVAEATGLIVPLGAWVLRRACRDVAEVNRTRGGRPLAVSVNISIRQVDHPSLVDTVARALAESGLPPELLVLEITESILASDPTQAADVLTRLRRLGVRIEVDDFGVGYSSLSRLGGFPLDGVKIDRGFVAEIGASERARSVVRATLAIAGALSLEVTAEGVETHAQADWLRANGCLYGQGFLFHRPAPVDAIPSLLVPAG